MLLKNKLAFTLVELLAVVMIVALLTAVAVPQYRKTVHQAETSEALINLRTIFDAAIRYKAQHSEPATNVKQLDVGFFDARVNNNVSYVGNFAYTFDSDFISACRVDGAGSTNTYCFYMYYKDPTYGRGAMFCEHKSSWSKKYESVCNTYCTAVGKNASNEVTTSYVTMNGDSDKCLMETTL